MQNLVEPDPLPPPPTTTTTTTTTDDSSSSSSSFPDREGFFTGHRIPIELFGEETKSRLLQEDALPHAEKKAYVDSSDFRSAGARVVALSETMEPPAHEPRFPPPSEVMLPPRPQPVLPSRRLPSREPLRPPPPSPQHFGGGGGFVLEGGIADQGSLLSTEKDPAYFGSLVRSFLLLLLTTYDLA